MIRNTPKEDKRPRGRILSVIGPGGIEIIHRVEGRDVEKVAAGVSKRVADRLEEEQKGREG